MRLLAFDTSTLVTSAAVVDGETVLAAHDDDVRSRSDNLVPVIDTVLKSAGVTIEDLDGVAVGAGPGSFTGLRIGLATAKGLCLAANRPLYMVSSLAALARDGAAAAVLTGENNGVIVALIDARRGELFAGIFRFRATELTAVSPENVVRPPDLLTEINKQLRGLNEPGGIFVCGDGVERYEELASQIGRTLTARATASGASVGMLAQKSTPVDLAKSSPTYIRPSEAEVKFPHGNLGGTFSKK